MALNYAEVWAPDLLETLMDGCYTSPLMVKCKNISLYTNEHKWIQST